MTTLAAYTGPTPDVGYVGYLNVGLGDKGVIITVRPESADGSGSARVTIPVDAAKVAFEEALAALHGVPLSDTQIKHMVNRFLGWKLPENFNPDGGVSFEPVGNRGSQHEYRNEPIGTNVFDYTQAEAMVRHMIEGMPTTTPA